MRKFRGKGLKDSKWYVGYFAPHGQYEIFFIISENLNFIPVIFETVGLSTGLNETIPQKREIYDGDIVEIEYESINPDLDAVFPDDTLIVKKIVLVDTSNYELMHILSISYHRKILGNIYDNPELKDKIERDYKRGWI